MRTYNNEFKQITKLHQEQFNCNAILFVNNGTADAYVNGQLLAAASATVTAGVLAINGLDGEIDKTLYRVNFTPGAVNKVDVIIKRYI